jgi:hypothetical protein
MKVGLHKPPLAPVMVSIGRNYPVSQKLCGWFETSTFQEVTVMIGEDGLDVIRMVKEEKVLSPNSEVGDIAVLFGESRHEVKRVETTRSQEVSFKQINFWARRVSFHITIPIDHHD